MSQTYTIEDLQRGIIQLDRQRNAVGVTEEQKAALAQDMRVLQALINSKKAQNQNNSGIDLDELKETYKTDPAGFANAIATGVNKGLISLVDLPFDAANLALTGLGLPTAETPSQAVDRLSEQMIGFKPVEFLTTSPTIDSPLERMVQTVAEYGSSGFGGAAAAREAGQRYLATQQLKGAPDTVTESLARTVTRPKYVPEETVVATAAGVPASYAREEDILGGGGELVASFGGGTAASLFLERNKLISGVTDQFTRKGAELRVGNSLAEETQNLDKALSNLTSNQLLIESVLPPGTQIDAARLTEDPGVMRLFQSAARNDSNINNILGRNQDNVSEGIIESLEELGGGDTQTFLSNLNAYTNDFISRLEDEIDLAKNQLDKIQTSILPRRDGTVPTVDQVSVEFVNALDTSYKRVKDYERRIWATVDKNVAMDGKRFRLMGLRLRNQMMREGFNESSFAGMFGDDEIMLFGKQVKKEDGTLKTAPNARNTFEALQRYRSRVLEAKREANKNNQRERVAALTRIDDLITDFIDSGPNADSYRAAAEVTRTINQNYNRGKLGKYLNLDSQGDLRIDPEVALTRIMTSGTSGVGEIRRILEAEMPNLEGVPSAAGLTPRLEDALILKFPFEGTDKQRANFLKQYEPTLRLFPHIARNLRSVDREIETVADHISKLERRVSTKTDEDIVGVAALLGADPNDIYATLKKVKRSDLKNINNVAVAEGVEQGLQSIYVREIVNKLIPEVASMDIPGKPATLSKILRNDKHLAAAFTDVLTADQRRYLSSLDKASTIAARDLSKVGFSNAAEQLTKSSYVMGVIGRFLGVKTAGVVGPKGAASLQFASTLSNVFSRAFDALPSAQAKAVLTRAVIEPEYLKELLKITSSTGLNKATEARRVKEFETLLRRSGIRAGQEIQRIYREEQEKQEESQLSEKALSYL